jgi:hypothetical protein
MLPKMAIVAGLLALLGSAVIHHWPTWVRLAITEPAAAGSAGQKQEYDEKPPEPYTGLTEDEMVTTWNVNKPFWRDSEDWERSMSSQYTIPWDGLVGGHH